MNAQDDSGPTDDDVTGFAAQLLEDLPPADVRHVLLVFGADLSRLTAILDAAVAAGDAGSFRRTAHALAGAAGAVGAAALEQACRAAMILPEAADAAALQARNAAVQAHVETAHAALDRVLRSLDPSHG